MFKEVGHQLKIAVMLLAVLMFLTGFIYPVVVTVFAQYFFPWQANGSLIEQKGKLIGSTLIGQSFSSNHYFWGRPSATQPYPYNGAASTGSNYGPSNPVFLTMVADRVKRLASVDTVNSLPIPVDLVTASGSGLDPDISIAAALYQVPRVATFRQVAKPVLIDLINQLIQPRLLGLLGEPRINVLQLNIALDNLTTRMPHG